MNVIKFIVKERWAVDNLSMVPGLPELVILY